MTGPDHFVQETWDTAHSHTIAQEPREKIPLQAQQKVSHTIKALGVVPGTDICIEHEGSMMG